MLGETISHYRILEKLGEGGMGVVYRAVDTRLDREVAIKFLPPHLSTDPEAVKRFIHEAKVASAIDHTHIGTIYEIDETDDGATFIVMALYDGETLRERIDRRRLGIDEALDIASQIASGLSKAHSKDIIHRDIKPSNIIITSDGVVKIIDFGLAKLAGRTKLTKKSSTLGTAAYMSPEQARGEEVGHRSDIFSLGSILYEMLSGEPPFKGDHQAALLYMVVHESPKPLTEYPTDLPDAVVSIVGRALEKDPAKRYQDASEMKLEITDFMKRRAQGETGRSGKLRRGVRSGSRARLWGTIAATVVLTGAVFSLIRPLLWRSDAPSTELTLAIIDFRDLSDTEDQNIPVGLTSFLQIGLDESSPIRVISSDLIYDIRRRLFGSGRGEFEPDQVLEVARESKATMFLTGQIFESGDERYVTWRLVETNTGRNFAARRTGAGSLAELADAIIEETLPLIDRESKSEVPSRPVSVGSVTTTSTLAYQHYIAGILALEERRTQKAVVELENAVKYDSSFALAYAALSLAHYSSMGAYSDRDLAIEYARKAAGLRSHISIKEYHRLEANLARLEGRVGDSLEILKNLNKSWPDDLEVARALIEVLFWDGYIGETLAVSGKSTALFPDDPTLASFHGAALSYSGRVRESLEFIKGYAEKHPSVLTSWDTVAELYLCLGMPDSAEFYYRKVLEEEEDFLACQAGLGKCEYARGNASNAITIFQKILERKDLSDGQRRNLLVYSVQNPSLALFYFDSGQYDRSREIFEEARKYVSRPHQEYFVDCEKSYFLLKSGRAGEVLSWARELATRSDVSSNPGIVAAYYTAKALIAMDSVQTARIETLDQYTAGTANGGKSGYIANEIAASIALAENDPDQALEALDRMSRLLVYHKAGINFFNYHEMKADALRMAGLLEDAADVHRELLRTWAGHAISHYELGKIYEEMDRPDDAKHEYGKFLEMWSEADEGLPQIEDARIRLTKLMNN